MNSHPPVEVFIDTCIYEELEFSFEDPALAKLCEHLAAGRARLHLTTITEAEVAKRVVRSANRRRQGWAELKNRATAFGVELPKREVAEPQETQAKFERGVQQLREAGGLMLHTAQGVDCERLVQKFHRLEPPFSKQKPDSFPDSIAMASLEGWGQQNDCRLLVVSNDRDWVAMAEQSSVLECIKITGLLARLAEVSRSDAVVTVDEDGRALLRRELRRLLDDAPAFSIDGTSYLTRLEATNVTLTGLFAERDERAQHEFVSIDAEADFVVRLKRDGAEVWVEKKLPVYAGGWIDRSSGVTEVSEVGIKPHGELLFDFDDGWKVISRAAPSSDPPP